MKVTCLCSVLHIISKPKSLSFKNKYLNLLFQAKKSTEDSVSMSEQALMKWWQKVQSQAGSHRSSFTRAPRNSVSDKRPLHSSDLFKQTRADLSWGVGSLPNLKISSVAGKKESELLRHLKPKIQSS